MGLSLIREFSQQKSEIKVLLVNRGNSYWGDECAKIISERPDRFERVIADRNLDSFAERVKEVIGDRTVLAVVDFSCYKLKHAERGIAVVPPTTKYIYISTDSTYNASGLLID